MGQLCFTQIDHFCFAGVNQPDRFRIEKVNQNYRKRKRQENKNEKNEPMMQDHSKNFVTLFDFLNECLLGNVVLEP